MYKCVQSPYKLNPGCPFLWMTSHSLIPFSLMKLPISFMLGVVSTRSEYPVTSLQWTSRDNLSACMSTTCESMLLYTVYKSMANQLMECHKKSPRVPSPMDSGTSKIHRHHPLVPRAALARSWLGHVSKCKQQTCPPSYAPHTSYVL